MPPQAKSLLMGLGLGAVLGFWATQFITPTAVDMRTQYPHAAVQLVTRATNMLNMDGHAAFEAFDRDPSFNRVDTYLFVLSADGTNIYHAADRSQVGENFAVLRDVDQRPFGLQLATDAAPGGVWSAYRWNNPATGAPEWKLTFSRQSRQGHIVAAGIYAGAE